MADALRNQDILDSSPQQYVVLFVALSKASGIVSSLASRLPPGIIPLPTSDLESLYRRGRPTVPVSGVVLCVPREQLSDLDRSVLGELEQILPIYSTCGQSVMTGREFFDMCRQTNPRVPRDPYRKVLRAPAIVSPGTQNSTERLITLGNVSQGGVFLQDPALCHDVSDLLKVRLFNEDRVLVQTEVRWIRNRKRPGEPLGYGCAFTGDQEREIKRLLELAETTPAPRNPLAAPRR